MTEQTASEHFAAWWNDCNDPLIMTPYSGQSGCHFDGGLIESAMWPDFTGPDPEDVEAFWGADYDGCSVTVNGYDYSLTRAVVRYVAYPIPSGCDWDGDTKPEFAFEAFDYVDWDAGVEVVTGLHDYDTICRIFSDWFEKHGRGLAWALREEASAIYAPNDALYAYPLYVCRPEFPLELWASDDFGLDEWIFTPEQFHANAIDYRENCLAEWQSPEEFQPRYSVWTLCDDPVLARQGVYDQEWVSISDGRTASGIRRARMQFNPDSQSYDRCNDWHEP